MRSVFLCRGPLELETGRSRRFEGTDGRGRGSVEGGEGRSRGIGSDGGRVGTFGGRDRRKAVGQSNER